ncbi:MAG: hypothetical protein IJ379_10905 [Lachnospiraceae bacterium]|nr:hypothetical protein [Lachnospiraceae bacterium]
MKIYDFVDGVVCDFTLAIRVSVQEASLCFEYENYNGSRLYFETREAATSCLNAIILAYDNDEELFLIDADGKKGLFEWSFVEK